ncbi:MAG: right-handed parallel beta-helix repeat-containing protein, partial [Planctomycetota bacterium]
RFEGNRANGQGGAISVQDVASARFEDCLFSDNSVGELPDIQVGTLVGGALFSFLPTELEIDGCVFDNNRAVGAESFGGALHIAEVGSELSLLDRVTIEDSLFVRNSAPDGGAILSDNAVIELVRSTAADNVATDATGTSVYATNSINLSADACVFWNNIGAPFGGIPFLNACFGQGTNGIDPGFTTGRGASFPGMDSEDEDGTFTAAGGYYLGAGSLAVDFAGVFACPGSDDDVCARTTSLVESFDDNGLLDAGYHYQTPRLGLHTILAESDGAETVQATIGSTVDLEFRAGAPTTNHDPTVARGWAIVTSFAAGSTPSGPISVPLGGAPQILSFGLFPVGDAAGLTALSVPVPMEPELVGVTIFASAVAIETWSAPPAYVTLGAGSQAGNLLDPNLMTIQFGL